MAFPPLEQENVRTEAVLFCPRCRGGNNLKSELCPECGTRAVAKGYCNVCESYWPLPLGELCPKHDLTLELPPETPTIFDAEDPAPDWVTIAEYTDALAASVPRMRLEAEGIPTFVTGERMASRSMYTVATGGAQLQVPRPLTTDARILLSQSWAVEDEDPEGLEDAWEDLAPESDSYRSTMLSGALGLELIVWTIGILVAFAFFMKWLST